MTFLPCQVFVELAKVSLFFFVHPIQTCVCDSAIKLIPLGLRAHLEKSDLGLTVLSLMSTAKHTTCYAQSNTSLSRKYILPEIIACLSVSDWSNEFNMHNQYFIHHGFVLVEWFSHHSMPSHVFGSNGSKPCNVMCSQSIFYLPWARITCMF